MTASEIQPTSNFPGAATDSQSPVEATAPTETFALLKQQPTLLMSRRIGYALLMLCFADLLYVLLPPEFTNPVWEYQTIGDVIKLVPVPMLALMLIFYGGTRFRSKQERLILNLLSWMTLVIGILSLLTVPLVMSNSVRINQFNNNQITTQVSQQKQQLDATRKQLDRASPEELKNLVPTPDQQGNLPDIPNSPQQAKAQILINLNRAKAQADQQAETARNNVRRNLVKNTIKLVVQSLIAGLFFIYIWQMTAWTRRASSYQNEPAYVSPTLKLPKLPRLRWPSRRARRR